MSNENLYSYTAIKWGIGKGGGVKGLKSLSSKMGDCVSIQYPKIYLD